jgi:hypothetical protein
MLSQLVEDAKDTEAFTVREHLLRAAERGSKGARAELESAPPIPDDMRYLWGYFQEVSLGRGAGGMGMSGLTWETVHAWMLRMDRHLTPYQIEALLVLDVHWRRALRKEDKRNAN